MNQYADATLTIHLDAIAANYHTIAAQSPTAECAAVVKANAYGLGVIPVSKHLSTQGCRSFFVATLDEALELRQHLPQARIAVFHGVRRGQEPVFAEHQLLPVINSLEQLRQWNSYAELHAYRLPCFLHVDTGMNRLGLSASEVEDLLHSPSLVRHTDIACIMSHLACAGKTHPMNEWQLANFHQITSIISGAKYSLANSAGCFMGAEYHFDLLRPGCSLYGVWSNEETPSPLEPAITLTARILQIRTVDRDGSVGYGSSYTIPRGGKLAVLPVGYADGYLRHLSNQGTVVHIAGETYPVAGRVSMDMLIVDISTMPEQKLSTVTEAELIGRHSQSVDELAQKAGTIGYEILTSLGTRYHRVYTS